MIGFIEVILALIIIDCLLRPRSTSPKARKRRVQGLLKDGLTFDQIAEKTKMTRDEISDIKNEMWNNGWENY